MFCHIRRRGSALNHLSCCHHSYPSLLYTLKLSTPETDIYPSRTLEYVAEMNILLVGEIAEISVSMHAFARVRMQSLSAPVFVPAIQSVQYVRDDAQHVAS